MGEFYDIPFSGEAIVVFGIPIIATLLAVLYTFFRGRG